MAEDANKKIAEWMKGKAEASEVVDALKEKASAEGKSIIALCSNVLDNL